MIHKLGNVRRLRMERKTKMMGYLPKKKSRQKYESQSGKSQ